MDTLTTLFKKAELMCEEENMQTSNADWITTKEFAKIKGISERAVRKAISKNKYVIRKCSKSYEILVTSLEENVREKVTAIKEKSALTESISYIVPETQKKLALAKYDLIKKWDEFRKGKKNKTIAGKDFLEAYNNRCICEELFNVIGKVAIEQFMSGIKSSVTTMMIGIV